MMATHRERRHLLRDIVDTIADQVDGLFIYLNDYSHREFIDLRTKLPSKCVLLHADLEAGDVKDNGKFYLSDQIEGWHVIVDDDIYYPPDYVETLKATCEAHDRKVAVGVHGRNFRRKPFDSYYKDSYALHFARPVEKEREVDVIGTGTLLYHRDHINVSFEDFGAPCMADVWFAKLCIEQGIKRVVVAREDSWLIEHQGMKKDTTIFASNYDDDFLQTKIINDAMNQ